MSFSNREVGIHNIKNIDLITKIVPSEASSKQLLVLGIKLSEIIKEGIVSQLPVDPLNPAASSCWIQHSDGSSVLIEISPGPLGTLHFQSEIYPADCVDAGKLSGSQQNYRERCVILANGESFQLPFVAKISGLNDSSALKHNSRRTVSYKAIGPRVCTKNRGRSCS